MLRIFLSNREDSSDSEDDESWIQRRQRIKKSIMSRGISTSASSSLSSPIDRYTFMFMLLGSVCDWKLERGRRERMHVHGLFMIFTCLIFFFLSFWNGVLFECYVTIFGVPNDKCSDWKSSILTLFFFPSNPFNQQLSHCMV